MDDRRELGVRHREPRKPDPVLADAAVQRSEPGQLGMRHVLQGECDIVVLGTRRRALKHLERGDDGGNLAGGYVREAHPTATASGCQSIATWPGCSATRASQA